MKQVTRLAWLLVGCTPLSSANDIVVFQDAGSPVLDAGPCPQGGTGRLDVLIDIPAGLPAAVTVGEGADLQQLTRSEQLTVAAGAHTVHARRVTDPGEVVGRAYYPADAEQTVCIGEGMRSEIRVRYELEPGSQKLWTVGVATSFHTASYAVDDLKQSGAPTPVVTIAGAARSPSAMAFDREGRLWLADLAGNVLGYERASLGSPRSSSTPDILLEGATVCEGAMPCGPQALAFDAEGDLWLALPDSVVRIDAAELVGRNEPSVATRLTGPSIDRPRALAFDAAGALWVCNGGDSSVVRFDAARLMRDDDRAADTTLLGQVLGPVFSGLSSPAALAFDASGNLWVGYLAPNVVARYSAEEQAKQGPVTPAVQLNVEALALVKGMAFDDAGNLWLTGQSKVIRIAAGSLAAGSDPAAEAVAISVDSSVEDLAFDPPGAKTPLLR